MPPKKKPRRDISGLKNQPKLTRDSFHTNEPMSDTAASPVSPDPSSWIDNDPEFNERPTAIRRVSSSSQMRTSLSV